MQLQLTNPLRRLRAALQRHPSLAWLLRAAQLLAGAGLLWWLISANRIDLGALAQRLAGADPFSLTLGIVCFAGTIAVIALRYLLFLPAGVSLGYMLGISLLQQALVNFVPWRLGEVSYPLLLRRDHAVPLAKGVAMLVAVRLADLAVVLSFAIVAMLRLGLELSWLIGLGVAGLALAALAALVAWRVIPERLAALRATLAEAYRPLRRPARLAAFVALSLGYFVLAILQSSLILSALGLAISPVDIASLQALSLLFALLPIHPPGGWGTTDTMQVLFLERLGHSPQLVLPVILVAHTVYTVLFALGGWLGWLLRTRERRAAVSAAARSTK